jgi:tRNA threonylcarbamoyl adenosine modification protein YeaZ
MKILAIEFSSAERSVALVEGLPRGNFPAAAAPETFDIAADRNTSRILARASELGGRRAIGLIEEVLKEANCGREEIEAIAVGLGPGSYTGIRGAIALAQGWQIGRGTKLLGVSSVECLAAQALDAREFGLAHIVIDAQRNEFYLASFQIEPMGARQVQALHLAGFARIEDLAGRGERVIGPDMVRWFPKARNMNPDAAMLGRIALSRSNFVSGESLEPIYLRETEFKKAPPARLFE